MKKIAIDVRLAKSQRGISCYITNLLIHFKKYSEKENIQIILFSDSKPSDDIEKLNYFTIIFPVKIYPLWDLFIPFYLLFYKIDLLHSPANTSPYYRISKTRYVTTIHDLIFFNSSFYGNVYQLIGRVYLKINVYLNIRRVDKIICVSNSTRQDLLKRFNIKEARLLVIYESCHTDYLIDSKPTLQKLNSFICFGSDDPRKNTEFVLQVFDLFVSIHPGYFLDIVGLPESYIIKLKGRLNLKNSDNFRFHPFISRESIFLLYKNSIALLYPSLYEGFGIPLIEAFKMKTPVITSFLSSMPEIAADAAILIDPNSKKGLFDALNFIIDSNNFDFFVKKSEIRSFDFEWDYFANSTFKLYIDES